MTKSNEYNNSQSIALEYSHNMIVNNSLHEFNDITIDKSLIESMATEIIQGAENKTSNSKCVRNVIENGLYNHTSSNNSDHLTQITDTMLYEEICLTGEEVHARGVSVYINSESKNQQDFEESPNHIALPTRKKTDK